MYIRIYIHLDLNNVQNHIVSFYFNNTDFCSISYKYDRYILLLK